MSRLIIPDDVRRERSIRTHSEATDRWRTRYRELQARFDSAQWTEENALHWSMADNLSPARMVSPEVRRTLRERSRYELLNNSWAWGMLKTKTTDVIGTGPRLQIQTENKEANKQLEQEWLNWSMEIGLGKLLATTYLNRTMSGEVFMAPKTNRNLEHPVQMTLFLIETDQVATPLSGEVPPLFGDFDTYTTDGIVYDSDNNVSGYVVLKTHPGSGDWRREFSVVPTKSMIHMFNQIRPNQPRGIPDATAALPLFAFLRRFTLATVAAAEIAASYSAVLHTTGGAVVDPCSVGTTQGISAFADESGAPLNYNPEVWPWDAEEITRGMMQALPAGWTLQQMQAEHPTTNHQMFTDQLITELARCFSIPFNRAIGKSKDFTWASGKLDQDAYLDQIRTERHYIGVSVLERILRWWWDEATLVGAIPPGMPPLTELKRRWVWDQFRETDPVRQAQADAIYWDKGLIPTQEYWLEWGKDPEEQYELLAEDIKRREEIDAPLQGRSAIIPEADGNVMQPQGGGGSPFGGDDSDQDPDDSGDQEDGSDGIAEGDDSRQSTTPNGTE